MQRNTILQFTFFTSFEVINLHFAQQKHVLRLNISISPKPRVSHNIILVVEVFFSISRRRAQDWSNASAISHRLFLAGHPPKVVFRLILFFFQQYITLICISNTFVLFLYLTSAESFTSDYA